MRPLRTLFALALAALACPNISLATGPFRHGVASGDPTPTAVILWTRATPAPGTERQPQAIRWQVAHTPHFRNVVAQGVAETGPQTDHTLKVDARGLQPNTWYYYRFVVGADTSPTGRTRTAPLQGVRQLRLGVASCSKLTSGYFSAYRRLAQRNDLDAIVHLGDYIYEYATQSQVPGRPDFDPPHMLKSLADFRTRYAQYRQDADLQLAHQQLPWLVVWDDHETGNDCWVAGAQHYDSLTYPPVKAAALQAWLEWMPIRQPDPQDPERIWRTSQWGDLLDLHLLDTRHYGRHQQVPKNDPRRHDSARTILGERQREWLFSSLTASTARWQVLGNQVILFPLKVPGRRYAGDKWDGYPASRQRLLNHIRTHELRNVAAITGDFHVSWVAEVRLPAANSCRYPQSRQPWRRNALITEWATPSIASRPRNHPNGLLRAYNAFFQPHIRWVELNHNGYFVLSATAERLHADYYTVDVDHPTSANERHARSFYRLHGDPRLRRTRRQAPLHAIYPPLAPAARP